MPNVVSVFSIMASGEIGAQKLGQPVPESNFCSDRKTGILQSAVTKVPFRCSLRSGLVNGRSVPASRRIASCSGVRSGFQLEEIEGEEDVEEIEEKEEFWVRENSEETEDVIESATGN